jgi:hypothetical protein
VSGQPVVGLVELGVIRGGAGEVPAAESRDAPQAGQLVVELPLTSIRPSERQPRGFHDFVALHRRSLA